MINSDHVWGIPMSARTLLAALIPLALAGAAAGHYTMLLPAQPGAVKGDKVEFVYQWGHPFEHELFDAAAPQELLVLLPDGKSQDLLRSLEKITKPGADDKPVTAYRLRFTPQQRGDHVFFLTTPPLWLDAEKEFVQDLVRVTLHVQTQNGWDADPGEGFRMLPVTRPYGLLPSMVFQGQIIKERDDEGVSPHIEIERYNPAPPKEVPAETLVTFRTRVDPNGVFTFAFPEAGWWCFTAERAAGTHARNGRDYPLRQRLTMWVHVERK
jgi:cobalt/nickel transport protein